jgi:hypothetical protein
MGKLFNRKNVLVTTAAIVLLPIFWWVSAGIRGNLQARYEVERGRYTVHLYGLPVIEFPEYQRVLREHYGVEMKAMGCILPMTSYYDSYDRVVRAAANRKFGRDVFKEAADQAAKSWEEDHKAELRSVRHSE